MKFINYCICCDSKNVIMHQSYMRQFVVDRMLGNTQKDNELGTHCSLIHCQDCDYVGSDVRFSLEEEARYYHNYGSDEWIAHRCRYDGEEIRDIMKAYEVGEYPKNRKSQTGKLLAKHINLGTISNVLDFGGNKGEMIPDELAHTDRYVLETEERSVAEGIKSISKDNNDLRVDLLICSQTLEHVSDPNGLINYMKKYIRPGGWIYLEVPYERVPTNLEHHGFHEHINCFSGISLTTLALRNNIELVATAMLVPIPHITSIAVLGKIK